MSTIFRCDFKGSDWGPWEDSYDMPPLPSDFELETCTVTFHNFEGDELCFAYDPFAGLLTWCTWDGEGWTQWHTVTSLPAPPNYVIDEDDPLPSNLSVATHQGEPCVYSYHPDDESVYISSWREGNPSSWKLVGELESPPNLSEATDVFAVGDETTAWFIALDLEEWSIYYCEWDNDEGAFSAWAEAPDIELPDEWYELGGIDIDGLMKKGSIWLYATLHDIDDDEYFD